MAQPKMTGSNPVLIQNPPANTPAARKPPLVLIHDGGGTIFSYHMLPSLGRPLYGIADPRFNSGVPWERGVADMAAAYIPHIKAAAGPRGRVVLGGWSLGGLTALNCARELAGDPRLEVVGLVMLDTVCPLPPPGKGWGDVRWPEAVVERRIDWPANTRPETREKVERQFANSAKMAWEWAPPRWEDGMDLHGGGEGGKGAAPREGADEQGEQGEEDEDEDEDEDDDYGTAVSRATKPPPAVLLRARGKVPVEGGMVAIDIWRKEAVIGWDHYRKDFFSKVLDIPGHHYGIFDAEHMQVLGEQLKVALETIDGLGR
jgi:thioesterase domain-containing protein